MKNAENLEPSKIVPSKETIEYWKKIKELIDAAGNYAAAIKLRANLLDEDTAWKVEHVLNETYEGKMSNLDDRIRTCRNTFYGKVEKVNIICKKYDLIQITKVDKLLDMLIDEKRRTSYKRKAKRKLAKNMIVPLQSFEPKKKK